MTLAGLLTLGRYSALPVDEAPPGEVERRLALGADYYRRNGRGGPPAREAADWAADALCDADRRLYLLRGEDGPVGMLELALHTPAPDEVTVVLLAVDRDLRARGVGREVALSLFDCLARERFARVRLGVAPGEDGAARFWESLGMWPAGEDSGVRLFELPIG